MPQILGSSSTFTLGGFGGHGGRALRTGDVLGVNEGGSPVQETVRACSEHRPAMTREWTIGVIPGPHCTGEFLQAGIFESVDGNEMGSSFQQLADGGSFDRTCAALDAGRWWRSGASSIQYSR